MSDTDSFIEEVNEEVRRDQLYKYVRKYAWIGVVVVVGIVGTTGFLEYQKASNASAAQALGDKFVAALNGADSTARADALAEVAPDAGAAPVIVDLRRAGELVAAGDTDGALKIFETIASSTAEPIYADMARLKMVMLGGKDMAAVERDGILAALAKPGATYRPLALEQQALVALNNDDRDTAVQIFTELFQDSASSDSVRGRAQQMLVALGADVPSRATLVSE